MLLSHLNAQSTCDSVPCNDIIDYEMSGGNKPYCAVFCLLSANYQVL